MKKSDAVGAKVALLTGAGQGIGLAMARAFAQAGLRVAVADVNRVNGRRAVAAIQAAGGEADLLVVDLRREKEVRGMVRRAAARWGRLDVLVNNARPPLALGTLRADLRQWDLALGVMLKAPALAAEEAYPYLERNRGCIINVVSTNAFSVSHQPASYHVAKAGLVQLTRYLACVFGPAGVRVNAVCPGLVDVLDGTRIPLSRNPVYREVAAAVLPEGKVPTDEEVAGAALFLASDHASAVTGHVLVADAGMTLGDPFHVAFRSFDRGRKKKGS